MLNRLLITLLFVTLGLVGCDRPLEQAATQETVQKGEPEHTSRIASGAPEDPYLWLEDVAGERVDAWIAAENSKTAERLTADPRFGKIQARFLSVFENDDRLPALNDMRQYRGQIYRLQTAPDRPRGRLARTSLASFASGNPQWEILFDVDAIAAEEARNWYVPISQLIFSPTAERVLVPFSDGGSDAFALREFDLAAGRFVEGGFETPVRRHHAVWEDEDTLLVATPLDDNEKTASAYPRHVRRWQRGQSLENAEIVFSVGPEAVVAAPLLFETATTRRILLGGIESFAEVRTYALGDAAEPIELEMPVGVMDVFTGLTGLGTQVVVMLQSEWTVGEEAFPAGARVAVDLERVIAQGGRPDHAVSLIYSPATNESLAGLIGSVTATSGAIYINVLEDVRSRVRQAVPSLDGGWAISDVRLPGDGAVTLPLSPDPFASDFLLRYENFLTPPALYLLDGGESLTLVQQEAAEVDLSPFVTEQHFAMAEDGTRVPYFITRARDLQTDGSAPVLMYAYGGFGIPMVQNHELFYIGPTHRIWLEQGGVFVLANPRGGGEYGPAWHQAAKRTTRQTVYDDIYAVAEDIAQRGISTPGQFGFIGGSNGGLTAGVVATQRPDLFGAAVSLTPLLDMARFHKLLSGASWMDEYGNPEDPIEGPPLLGYSPYHNVKPEADYPEIFLLTSTRDDRVHPGHARKMAKKMKDQGHDVLFYEAREGGHAMAVNNEGRAFNAAMQTVYLMQKLMDGSATDPDRKPTN